MSKFPTDEIATLLHIHDKALGHPQLKNIRDASMSRLNEIEAEMEPNAEGGVMGSGPKVYVPPSTPDIDDPSKGESSGDMTPSAPIIRRTAAPDLGDASKQGSG